MKENYSQTTHLRISPNGFASWSVDYTRPGTKRENGPSPKQARARYTIGPEDEITLAQARETAREIRERAGASRRPGMTDWSCGQCGRQFTPSRDHAKYCSPACRSLAWPTSPRLRRAVNAFKRVLGRRYFPDAL
jgi:hypothetical protein